ncbi:MAG: helix-turn-helix transcriptional regulator [Ruminococcaceae bacterium]|nr:helix-turn-helix transcriptional regulator [Oscillospiraceae bacterium]
MKGIYMENSNIVKQAIDYIRNESYKSDMTIDDVAANAGFSTNYFNSIFAAHTGFNVMEYVRFIRLKNAAMLLLKTNREVLDIALECGYEAHESFTRAFKRQYGNTPNEYRKKKSRAMFFEDFCNETVGARMIHEFPQLKSAR